MSAGNTRLFSHSPWYPWILLPGMALFGAMLVVLVRYGRIQRPIDFVAAPLVLLLFVVLLFVVSRNFILSLLEPHSIAVSDEGIEGRPILGPTVAMAWGDVRTVEVVGKAKQRLARAEETVRMWAPDSRILVFDSRLPDYSDLKRVVQQRAVRAEWTTAEHRDPNYFSYPNGRVRNDVLVILGMVLLLIIFLVFARPLLHSPWWYLLLAIVLVPGFLLAMADLVLGLRVSWSVVVTASGIVGHWAWGAPVEIDWGEASAVVVGPHPLLFGLGPERVRVRSRDGRREVAFDEILERYTELRSIVLERTLGH